MSTELKEKASEAMKKVFLCGAVFTGSVIGSGALMKSFWDDVEKNPPKEYVADDGHMGTKFSGKQSAKVLGSVALGTTAFVAAAMFGRYLVKEEEKEQAAVKAAIRNAKQQGR